LKLTHLQIRDFRCIEDSGEFTLNQVTCLVGKNESGKTAILKALQKLKPDDTSKESFVPSKDYPRRKWRPDSQIPSEPPAIKTTWNLSAAEIAAIESEFGKGSISNHAFSMSKGFDNVRKYKLVIDNEKVLSHFLPDSKLSPEDMEPISKCDSVDEVLSALKSIAPRSPAQEKLLKDFEAKFPKGGELAIINFVAALMPTFLYFDEYLTLPGTVAVNEIATRKQQNALNDRDKIFIALLDLAGTSVENVNSTGTYEEFNASLRAVSNQITDMIFQYWSQNKHLDVDIKLDFARPSDPPPFNAGWIFRTRIDNRRHRADTSFDDRSRGFVWFFSFLIWFNQLKKIHGENLIILLDEPGLSLHARAQADLLKYIAKELCPKYQVVYTTHSPFMIDPDNLLSARTVEDVVRKDRTTGEEILLGTKVGEDVLSTDADTVSPLQKALDYELTQTLFVGKHTLLVEGESDFAYLRWFSKQLQSSGKTGLDYRWNICICGGVSRIPGFVSLFRGNGLHVAAITDVQIGDKNKIENAKKSLSDGHLVTVDAFAGQSEADIEDVLGREFYVALVSKALDLRPPYNLPESKPATAPVRVAKEVDQHTAVLPPNYANFDHFLPAEWLFQHEDEGAKLAGFDLALSRMGKLIGAVNTLI
jgi:energy-coupling factor transporter ATP-binding protein EcfA2